MTYRLRAEDLEPVITLDALILGRRPAEYFKVKLDMAVKQAGMEVSLAAELHSIFAGILIARVYYGEFGMMDRMAVLEVFGVHPDFRGRHVARELLRQLRTSLLGLGLKTVSTEVHWTDQEGMPFFHHEGFAPAPRLCLDLDLEEHRRREKLEL